MKGGYNLFKRTILRVTSLIAILLCSGYAKRVQAQIVASGIRGSITDGKTPVAGAIITIEETKQSSPSTAAGTFLMPLKPGSYTLSFKSIGLKTETRRLIVKAGKVENIAVAMVSAARMLGGVSVQASKNKRTVRALLELRRASSNIQDAIGAVEIEKTASITTAQALARVTGVTVKDGKYITVRGLTDRNIVVQLNGARLPGADAGRSAVGLDLIPAQLLENIVVEKSITPDKPGDANGALVEITTKAIPDSRFMDFTVQTGFNGNIGIGGFANSFPSASMGAFGDHLKNFNLSNDYINLETDYTAGGASVPRGTLRAALNTAIAGSSIDQAHYNEALRIARVMQEGFSPFLKVRPERYPLDQIYGLTLGDKFMLKGDKVIGIIFGLNYYNRSQSNPDGTVNLYTSKIPSGTGAGEPNIIYPNESRLIRLFSLSENTGQHQLSYGGLGTFSFRFNKFNELSLTYNSNFGAETSATLEDGTPNSAFQVPNAAVPPTFPGNQHIYDHILRATERSLNSLQLRGDHSFRLVKKWKPWQVVYSASEASARQNDPDYRETRLRVDSNASYIFLNTVRNTRELRKAEYNETYFAESDRYYRLLKEKNMHIKIDLTVPFSLNAKESSVLKAGAYYYERGRNYREAITTRTDLSSAQTLVGEFGSPSQIPGNLTTLGGDIDRWSSNDQIGIKKNANTIDGSALVPGYLYIPQPGVNVIGGVPFISSYNASQKITAFYLMCDLKPTLNWRLIGGLRVENTDYISNPDTTGSNFTLLTGVKDQEDFTRRFTTNYLAYNLLPSGSVVYKGLKNFNFRVAYSKTLIRPEINELALTSQRDPIQQLTLYGNKDLKNGVFSNYDFRTDWFIGQEELVSGSFFYKTVVGQLERVYLPALANGSTLDQFGFQNSFVSYRNNPNIGKIYGIEFELRKSLKGLFAEGKFMHLGANFLLSRSSTQIDSVGYRVVSLLNRDAPTKRPLVDQPLYALNVNFDFDKPSWGTQMNVLYNRVGKRLSDINSDGTPNIYEFPASSFDIVFSQRIAKRLQFKAFAKNLFNSATRYYYTEPGQGRAFGVDQSSYLKRSFSYGAVFTAGIRYTL